MAVGSIDRHHRRNEGDHQLLVRMIVFGAVAALIGLTGPTPASAATVLVATVGPGSSISLKTSSGREVTKAKSGIYKIVIRDRSTQHNFHLLGPTAPSLLRPIDRRTTVAFVGTRSWTVTLRPGSYRYFCDPHRSSMRGSFRVTRS
jgi:plastocyanin